MHNDPHVVSALKRKRAEIAGAIRDIERELGQRRADLTHIDATLKLIAPSCDPHSIRPKRVYVRRTRYFANKELSRRVLGALRDEATHTATTTAIVVRVMTDKGFDGQDGVLVSSIRERALDVLGRFARAGLLIRLGSGTSTKWALPAD